MKATLFSLTLSLAIAAQAGPHTIELQFLGRTAPIPAQFDTAAAEIGAYDPRTRRLFVVNGATDSIDIVSLNNPSSPTRLGSIALAPFGGAANSVKVHDGVVAVALEVAPAPQPGKVVFFDAYGAFLKQVQVGVQPDHISWSDDGRWVLTANEGEPAGGLDPEGSVSIIKLRGRVMDLTQADVRTVTFSRFNGTPLDPSIKIDGPGATVAMDLEPEFIALSHDAKTAWVTCQDNNAIAIVDVHSAQVTRLVGLGFKDHSQLGNGLDASDRDGRINIQNWPVKGLYQPDSISSFLHRGKTYLAIANEGDSRAFEEGRVADLNLDSVRYPDRATLQRSENLGRLKAFLNLGDEDGDGDVDQIFSFGTRSFSVLDDDGKMVFDSGEDFEQIIAAQTPAMFNSDHGTNAFDARSDDKGPEPEGLTTAKLFGRDYAFIGLERVGGTMVYDVSDPRRPTFVQYLNTRNFTGNGPAGTAGDLGPEGLLFISADDSPNGRPLLVVTHEVSGTTTVLQINRSKKH